MKQLFDQHCLRILKSFFYAPSSFLYSIFFQGNFWVIAANLGLSFLAVFHLAYLGIMFGGDSEIQEKVIVNKNDFITVKIFLARFIICFPVKLWALVLSVLWVSQWKLTLIV